MPADMDIIMPETFGQRVENSLGEAIMSSRFHLGERLIERELCESLGVSRTSTREALRKLEAEKLVCIGAHKGPQMAMISEREAEELYALRGVLKGYAAHEFAKNSSDEVIAEFGHRYCVRLRCQPDKMISYRIKLRCMILRLPTAETT